MQVIRPLDLPSVPRPTRSAGLEKLARFAPRMGGQYRDTRNYDLGIARRDNVSGLSAHVRHRLVLEEEVVRAALERHSPAAAEKFIQEQFWRSYWKGWLEQRPQVWDDYLLRLDEGRRALDRDGGLMARWQAAIEGRTGIAPFDAWAQELQTTGYLHNHARMWAASIWIFTLRLPWALGACWFMERLLDGDPASNTLSWRWVAGLHTRGKHYLARAANIAKYTDGRFDPKGQLDETAEPILGWRDWPKRPLPMRGTADPGLRTGWLLTGEDLTAESLDPGSLRPVALAGGWAEELGRLHNHSPLVRSWVEDAIADGLRRASAHFDLPMTTLPAEGWREAVLGWARTGQLQQMVTGETPVGPWATLIDGLAGDLEGAGIRLVRLRRRWDAVTWPHATRGFFALKQKIPEMIGELGLERRAG